MPRWKQVPVWALSPGCLIIAVIATISALSRIGTPFAGFLIGKGRNVYPIAGPSWVFKTTKLKARDRIVAINEKAINSYQEFNSIIKKIPSGKKTAYTLNRNGRLFQITARIQTFTTGDFFIAFGILFIIGLSFLITGLTVFYLKSQLPAARVFALFCNAVGLCFITLFDAYSSLQLVLFLDISLHLVPALMVHLACLFPSPLEFYKNRRYLIPLTYTIFLLLWRVKASLEVQHYHIWTVIDQIGDLLILAAYLFFIAVLIKRSSSEPSLLLRKRAQIALVGMSLAFSLPGVAVLTGLSNGALPLNFSFLTALFFPLYLGYAIIRHNFFNAEKIIVNTVFYLLYISLLIFLFVGLSTISGLLFKNKNGAGLLPAALFAIFVLMLSRVQNYLKSLIDRLFFRYQIEKTSILFETSRAIRKIYHLSKETIPLIKRILNTLGINRAAVLLRTPKGFSSYCSFALQGESAIHGSRATLAFIEKHAEILTPFDLDEIPVPVPVKNNLGRIFTQFPSSLLMPIMLDEKLIGCLVVGERPDGRTFREADLEILLNFSNQLAFATINTRLMEQVGRQERIEKELEIAAKIQQHFLPKKIDGKTWYEAAFHYQPAREVGGDIYDFFQEPPGNLGVITGDVSGKGIPAALFGAVSSGIIKAGWEETIRPADFLRMVNKQLSRIRFGNLNIALSCALFNLKNRTMTFTNRGLPFPIKIRKKAEFLISGGLPLAIKSDNPFDEKEIPFRKGDTFIFYSDGLVECKNNYGEILGFDRLLAIASETVGMDPESTIQYMLERITSFTGHSNQEDDRIIQVIRILQ